MWLEVLLAAGAYLGAVGFLTGGIDLGAAARDLPFASPVFAGIMLGLINGLLPTVVVIGQLTGRAWAAPGHVVVGLALIGWIVVQVALIGLGSWLQVAYFVWGVAILGLALAHRRTLSRAPRRHPTPAA